MALGYMSKTVNLCYCTLQKRLVLQEFLCQKKLARTLLISAGHHQGMMVVTKSKVCKYNRFFSNFILLLTVCLNYKINILHHI